MGVGQRQSKVATAATDVDEVIERTEGGKWGRKGRGPRSLL